MGHLIKGSGGVIGPRKVLGLGPVELGLWTGSNQDPDPVHHLPSLDRTLHRKP